MMVVTIVAVLATVATAGYGKYIERARVAAAIADIGRINLVINRYRLNNNDAVPSSLADIQMDSMRDPWGNRYRYLDFSTVSGNGAKRKDRNLVPINSDFDLYSMGADGKTATPLTARVSQDDIILANNGSYVGLAQDY